MCRSRPGLDLDVQRPASPAGPAGARARMTPGYRSYGRPCPLGDAAMPTPGQVLRAFLPQGYFSLAGGATAGSPGAPRHWSIRRTSCGSRPPGIPADLVSAASSSSASAVAARPRAAGRSCASRQDMSGLPVILGKPGRALLAAQAVVPPGLPVPLRRGSRLVTAAAATLRSDRPPRSCMARAPGCAGFTLTADRRCGSGY